MADGTAERPGPGTDFDAVWRRADEVPGWLKPGQGRLLWDEAIALHPGATILEIGSHQGRSTVVLAEAARRVGATVVAVDPFVEGRLFGGVVDPRPLREHAARQRPRAGGRARP